MTDFSYRDYVTDEKFLAEYNSYLARYAGTMRESDKVLVPLIRQIRESAGRDLDVLDIGCSTGNLLLHLRNMVPGVNLAGGDLAKSSIDECRANPKLAGIAFDEMDLLNLPQGRFDVVIVNASTCSTTINTRARWRASPGASSWAASVWSMISRIPSCIRSAPSWKPVYRISTGCGWSSARCRASPGPLSLRAPDRSRRARLRSGGHLHRGPQGLARGRYSAARCFSCGAT